MLFSRFTNNFNNNNKENTNNNHIDHYNSDQVNSSDEENYSYLSTSPFEFLMIQDEHNLNSNNQLNNQHHHQNHQQQQYITEIIDLSDYEESDVSSLGSYDFQELECRDEQQTIDDNNNSISVKQSISKLNNIINENNYEEIKSKCNYFLENINFRNPLPFPPQIDENIRNDNEEIQVSTQSPQYSDIDPDNLYQSDIAIPASSHLCGTESGVHTPANRPTNTSISTSSSCSNGQLNIPPPQETSPLTIESLIPMLHNSNSQQPSQQFLQKYQKEMQLYSIYLNKPFKVGDTWYLISYHWFREWTLYIEAPLSKKDAFLIGPIDNSNLLLNEDYIKSNLIENHHYALIPEEMWLFFESIYGSIGPSIPRKVIKNYFTQESVDLKLPIPLLFLKSSNVNNPITIYTHKNETIQSLKEKASIALNVNHQNVRIWDYYNHFKHCELKPKSLVNDTNLLANQYILLEEKQDDDTYPPYRI
ncbi:peptidase C19 family protein [Tieghemostelium lacteum]|uniref:Peptidase C19 family protein n=1 Tax=Tieghemostelium lacteum TaxID=361077 RepID=A0A152A808_TIELA|nr:peptidase C19 family protein [Tieghemostelium lacteum]|eukprot:KYR02255.1 peptidase C19 family protein [Tieghemostelium lacteum]